MQLEICPALEAEMKEYLRVARTALMICADLLPSQVSKTVRPDITAGAFAEGTNQPFPDGH
jgi:hypothetical protein